MNHVWFARRWFSIGQKNLQITTRIILINAYRKNLFTFFGHYCWKWIKNFATNDLYHWKSNVTKIFIYFCQNQLPPTLKQRSTPWFFSKRDIFICMRIFPIISDHFIFLCILLDNIGNSDTYTNAIPSKIEVIIKKVHISWNSSTGAIPPPLPHFSEYF